MARQLGFKAMQFNFVVATNSAAVHVWDACGFTGVGAFPPPSGTRSWVWWMFW